MTLPEIVREVSLKTGMTQNEVKKVIDVLFDEMAETLKKGEKVMVSGFGTFTVEKTSEHKVYNLHTKEYATVPEKRAIRYKVSKKLKKNLNE